MQKFRVYDFNEEENCYDLVATALEQPVAEKFAKLYVKKGYIVKEDRDDPYLGKVIWSNR